MCGIVGVIGDFARDECLEIVHKMNAAIVHRGPDDYGVWSEDGFGFGVRRLSIIDIEGGHQPMWDEGTGVGIVFNGEIYNYRQVRDQLIECGQIFHTRSDTEVVLKSLAYKGLPAVHWWNGMFAVAAWNSKTKRLLLIRDRLGVKPLYYFLSGTTFLFASEIKAILASGLVEPRVDSQAIWDYLTFRYISSPESVWEGIKKLSPGYALEFQIGKQPQEIRYWASDVIPDTEKKHLTDKQLDREFEELFVDAVRLRFIASDVPIGILLSGGLDSSAIAAASVDLGYRHLHTFSVAFEDGGYFSELPYARKVAKHVGANHHEVIIGQRDFLDMLPEVVHHLDEPLADLPSVPLLAVSRLARKYVKAVLTGDGCDEIFAGYEDFATHERRWELVRSLQMLPKGVLEVASLFSAVLPERYRNRVRRIAEVPLASWYERDYPTMTSLFNEQQKSFLWPGTQGKDSTRLLRDLYAETQATDPLQQVLSVFQKTWLVEDLLMKADKISMATSLELRTPFLDYRLVEWANRRPKRVKLRRIGLFKYETKSVVRRFCARRLPKEIVYRAKRGFPVPAEKWLANSLEPWANELLLGPESRLSQAFSRKSLSELLASSRTRPCAKSERIWLLIILEFWLRVWETDLAEKRSTNRGKKVSPLNPWAVRA